MMRYQTGSASMPTEIAIIVAVIVIAFGTFAGVLAWADRYSSQTK
jgi:hypothetical protein